MTLHPFVMVFILVWFTGVGIGFFAVLNSMFQREQFEPAIFIPLFMLVFGYALTTGAFKYESKKTKKFFTDLLEIEEEPYK